MIVSAGAALPEGTVSAKEVRSPHHRALLLRAVPHGHRSPYLPADRLMLNWWPLRGFQKITERRALVSGLKLATPGLCLSWKRFSGKKKVGKTLWQSAYFRVGKLGGVPAISLGQQKKEGVRPGQG